MRFEVFFGLAVLLLAIDPTRFANIGKKILSGLMPLAEQGLTLAIIVVAMFLVIGKLKL